MFHGGDSTSIMGVYEVFVDSELFEGSLSYGELIIPGSSEKEIFLSTYICHPSMANNELSGLCVTTYIAKWIEDLKKRRFTYRIIFVPETIGSITYLSKNLDVMKKNIFCGFNVSCVGDDRAYSFIPSRNGKTMSDIVGRHILKWIDKNFAEYKWTDRGSDERQYCAPFIDLPVASIMRTKYGSYDEVNLAYANNQVGIHAIIDFRDEKNKWIKNTTVGRVFFNEILPKELRCHASKNDKITEIIYPVNEYPEKVKSLGFDKLNEIEGRLWGIKGQYLIFDNGEVLNIRKHNGYEVTLKV